ncbi:MAG: hypothetical protein AB7O69_17445 [Burkholderiales bacterium]
MTEKTALHESVNTSSWVDELYSKRLTKQAFGYVGRRADEETPVDRLSTLRSSRIYLREEIVRGPGVKQSIRAYFLDLSISGTERTLSIVHCDYDPRNGRMRSTTARAAVHVAVTPHALERLYERLRTNALGDVYRLALRPLSRVPTPTKDQYDLDNMVIHLAGFGIFPVKTIGAFAPTGEGVPCWGVLTYIDREPRKNEIITHTIGPEQ